jgi:hypothetical protein
MPLWTVSVAGRAVTLAARPIVSLRPVLAAPIIESLRPVLAAPIIESLRPVLAAPIIESRPVLAAPIIESLRPVLEPGWATLVPVAGPAVGPVPTSPVWPLLLTTPGTASPARPLVASRPVPPRMVAAIPLRRLAGAARPIVSSPTATLAIIASPVIAAPVAAALPVPRSRPIVTPWLGCERLAASPRLVAIRLPVPLRARLAPAILVPTVTASVPSRLAHVYILPATPARAPVGQAYRLVPRQALSSQHSSNVRSWRVIALRHPPVVSRRAPIGAEHP